MLDHGLAVLRDRHQAAERRSFPIAGTQDDRDDACFLAMMALQRTRHLDVVAILGGDEIGTDQQQDDVGAVELVADLAVELVARSNAAVVPCGDRALTFEGGKMLLKLVSKILIRVRMGHDHMHGLWNSLVAR